jgi:hypothetical protein
MPSAPKGTTWSTALLVLLKAPPTPANYQFLNQWLVREHGHGDLTGQIYGNNPFFTTAGGHGTVGPIKAGSYPLIPDSAFSSGRNTAGVPAYPNLATGVWITALHIGSEYPAIWAALKSGNPAASQNNPDFQAQLNRWSGGGYSDFQTIAAPAGPVGEQIEETVSTTATPAGVKFQWSATSGVGGALAGAGSAASGALQHVPGVKQAEAAAHAAEATASFLGKLTDPHYILRGLQIVAGGVLVLTGGFLLVRQVALAADVPPPLVDPSKMPGAGMAMSMAK